jgi:hypothetical protein
MEAFPVQPPLMLEELYTKPLFDLDAYPQYKGKRRLKGDGFPHFGSILVNILDHAYQRKNKGQMGPT